MRAAICPEYGEPEVVVLGERPTPTVEDDQVLVRVGAAAVNYPDVLLVAGRYQVKVPPPFVPGSECAGVVSAVGADVTGVTVGDRVSTTGLFGAFAEELAVRVRSLTPVPEGVPDRLAAAFGVSHRTAYHALTTLAEIRPGERLVVLGAGGGVGMAAVQLGAAVGAEVVAVAAGAEKLAVARSTGAAHTIDPEAGGLRQQLRDTVPDGVDVVLDAVGGDLAEPALRALRPGGRFVSIGYASGTIPSIPLNLALVKDISIHGLNMQTLAVRRAEAFGRNTTALMGLLADGAVLPHISAEFPLEKAADALRHVADGHAIGKVVLDIGGA